MVQKLQTVPHWLEFIPVDRTETEAYLQQPDSKTDKAHLFLYLNSHHWNENKDKKQMEISRNAKGGGGRQAQAYFKRYNRIAFFADCMKEGRVCSKIMETHADCVKFFDNMVNGSYGIGWVYLVEE